MAFKINISDKKGKTYHIELESEEIQGKKLHDKLDGKDILPALEGYEMEIMGASDKAGFPSFENVEGVMLKKLLLKKGKGMKKRPRREGKKKWSKNMPKGLKLKKTVRGNTISTDTMQINVKVTKEGSKKLADIFPEQCQPKEKAAPKGEADSAETAE